MLNHYLSLKTINESVTYKILKKNYFSHLKKKHNFGYVEYKIGNSEKENSEIEI